MGRRDPVRCPPELLAGQLCPSQQGRAAGAWQCPTECPTCPARQHQPGLARALGTAANSWWRHQRIHGLAASFTSPKAKGCSRIHCCSQSWELCSAWSPPSSSQQSQPGSIYDTINATFEETLELVLALSSHSQARLKSAHTKCAYN